jgi:exodeoxyribonuclease I
MQPTYFWHDYETFGADPRRDRPSQFAGVRTDANFEPIDAPVSFFCKPTSDLLPHPEACLITGITPQLAAREGIVEPEFFARIHEQIAQPGTCTLGYNSIRFDDEVTRHGLWRNFFDPYGREWRNGCSRWDLIDALRMAYALRPQGIEWPRRDGDLPSFRLEHLSNANGIKHAQAHDALNDVMATLGLAKRFRKSQPKLFDYLFALREKRKAAALLDWNTGTPVLHASSRFSAERGCLAMVMPITQHPTQPNGVIVVDLDADPSDLIELDASDIRDRVFVARADLPEDIRRIPLKTVHVNKSPALAPIATLGGVDLARIGLDVERCLIHRERLLSVQLLAQKVREVFSDQAAYPKADAESDLYSGLPGNHDLDLATKVRRARPEQLKGFSDRFADARYRELLFRYRARHYPGTLDNDEQQQWHDWKRQRMIDHPEPPERGADFLLGRIASLRRERAEDGSALRVLDQVESWIREVKEDLQ